MRDQGEEAGSRTSGQVRVVAHELAVLALFACAFALVSLLLAEGLHAASIMVALR